MRPSRKRLAFTAGMLISAIFPLLAFRALLVRQGLAWADIGRAGDMQSEADPRLEAA
ncbi:MAG: hypothetical protein OXN88_02420 [Chloroflexota bacterium]|nr:hypothetical protein [Chloroflexota bacterium]